MTADPEGSGAVRGLPGVVDEPRGGTSAFTNGWLGPGWRVFDASPSCGKQVRDWVSRVVGRHAGPADPVDAALVVAELFANAVMHGPPDGRVLVGYCLWPGGARIFVCDGGGATIPRLREAGELEEGGRGLRVVDAVAAAWGSFRAGSAQAVWCDLGKPLNVVVSTDASAWLRVILSGIDLAEPRAAAQRLSPVLAAVDSAAMDRQRAAGNTPAARRAASTRLRTLRGLASAPCACWATLSQLRLG
ncbi:MAG TPA: ATP-binding protein [Streptosporangiaceae bacterium]|nr:ATP-binding protein [Streptosporangiaceae bacterium]